MRTMQWSDAARTPRDVAAAVESSGEVRLERRGEVPFVIIREDRAQEAQEAMETAARVLRNMVSHDRTDVLEAMLTEALPWSRFLPDKDRKEFAREFAWTIEACSDLKFWAPLGRMLHEWQQTAAIHADPDLAQELSRALNIDLGPVLMPSQEDLGAEEE